MAHTHSHHHGHAHDDSSRNLGMAFFLNLGFSILEFIGGIWTNSVAITSDAVHDLGDACSIGTSYFLERYSNKKRSKTFTYGYKRFSTLGALINSLVLLLGVVFVFSQTLPRLFNPQEVDYSGMMWLAIIGVAINGWAASKLMKGNSVNQRAVMLHLMEDVLGWVAVLIGSIVIRYTGWYIIDPLLSLAIGIFILVNVCRNLYAIFRILLQAVPTDCTSDKIEKAVGDIDGVLGVHDVHVWTLDGIKNIASIHVVVKDDISREDIIRIKNKALQEAKNMEIDHLTVEIEYKSEVCHGCEEY